MKQVYHVTGKYLARYPDGHYTGDIGISADINAKSPKNAKTLIAQKTANTYGFVDFKWLSVSVKKTKEPTG